MVKAGEEVQFRRLPRTLEHLNRLLGRRYRILGGMNQQQRTRRDVADHFVGAEIEHALRCFRREHIDRIRRQHTDFLLVEIFPYVARDWHDVVARHHQRFAGALAVLPAIFEHLGELGPGFRCRMLAAEFALTVAPAAV